MDTGDVVSIISAVVALVSLCAVFYKEFVQGAEIQTSVDRMSLLRVPPASRDELLLEALVDDLLSDPITQNAKNLVAAIPGLQQWVAAKNRHQCITAVLAHAQSNRIEYDPSDSVIEKYFSDQRFNSNFYIPLVVENTGRKTGYVSNIVLRVRDRSYPEKNWAFVPFTELEPRQLLARAVAVKDVDRIRTMFSGFSVAPLSYEVVHPWFTSLPDADSKIISRTNLGVGSYEACVFLFGKGQKHLHKTEWISFDITKKHLIDAFKGTDSMNCLSVDKQVAAAVADDS